jgi:integrase
MTEMKLSQHVVDTIRLPPGKTDWTVWDDDVVGLGLRLRAGGARGFVFWYRLGRKQRKVVIGSAATISAKQARETAVKLYAQAKLGQDPASAKQAARATAAETFGALLPQYLDRQKQDLRPRAYVEVDRHLTGHAKRLHALPLAAISRRDVAGVLSATAAQLSAASANRVRSSLSGFFSWAIREGLLESNPASWTERRDETPRVRQLSDDELCEIWAALRADAYGDIIKLLVLTGARREEIGALRWSEIDFERGLIVLPPARVKSGRTLAKRKLSHEIVLSEPAAAILKARSRLTWPDGSPCDLVFGRGARGFADWVGSKIDLDHRILAARQITAKKGAKVVAMPGWVLHDLRRLISTTMHERLGVQPHIVEAILGHVGHKAGVAGVYNLATYRADKARAAGLWAEHVLALVEERESKVVPMRTT